MDKSRANNTEDSFFEQYNRALRRYPLLVNGIQAAIIAGIGVLISQSITGAKTFDWQEVRIMALINLAYNTPVLLVFYGWLSNAFSNTITKLLIDQLLFSPMFNAGIIGLRMFLYGTHPSEIPPAVWAILPKAMSSSWMFWFPTRYLTMTYVPPDLQLLMGSLGGLVWNVIFSMILNS